MLVLSEEEIKAALAAHLKAKGARYDMTTLKFYLEPEGLRASLEGEIREEKVLSPELILKLCNEFNALGEPAAVATVQRPSEDSFSRDPLQVGDKVLWLANYGVTRTFPEQWPEALRTRLGPVSLS